MQLKPSVNTQYLNIFFFQKYSHLFDYKYIILTYKNYKKSKYTEKISSKKYSTLK